MSQLTITSYYTRKTIKIGIIFLISFLLLKTGFKLVYSYWRKLHPLPPPPPNTAFGKLPAIAFPTESQGAKPATFQLETIEGGLPTKLPTTEKVYFIPQTSGRFLSLEKTTKFAKKLGFTSQPQKISEEIYQFKNSLASTTLTVNVLTENFHYQYNYLNDQSLINPPSIPQEPEATQIAKNFLQTIGKFNDDLENGVSRASYWKIETNYLVPAIAPADADFIKISFLPEKISDYSVLPPNIQPGLISILISGINIQSQKIVEVRFTHFSADKEKFATYPLKTIQQAWEKLQAGKFFLASLEKNQEKQTIKIRKIYLAYFDPSTPAHFLQPIFVFQGDNNFYGYVPAVSFEWLEE